MTSTSVMDALMVMELPLLASLAKRRNCPACILELPSSTRSRQLSCES
jgi:hypothetical protein